MRILTAAAATLILLLLPAAASAMACFKAAGRQSVPGGKRCTEPNSTMVESWLLTTQTGGRAEAADVWFEAPMDAGGLSAATQAALAHAFLPEGQRLQALLSPAGRKRLAAAAQTLEVPVERLDRLQPWYAELMIQSGLFEKLGVSGSDGVEEQLWAGLSPTAKRATLETPEQQIGFFADAPIKEQVASLEQTLKDVPHAERDYQELLKAWLGADIRTLDRQVVAPLKKSSPGLYDRVVTQRNARWIKAIDRRLGGSGETVIVVGMGHLIGPDGLPAQLRAQGYAVEGPR